MLGAFTGFVVIALPIALGYLLARIDLLGKAAIEVLTRLTFYVLAPFLMFVVLSKAQVSLLFSALLPAAALAAIAVFGIQWLLTRVVWKRDVGTSTVATFSSGLVNANQIGIPISLYLLGNAAYSAPVMLIQLLVFGPIVLVILGMTTKESASFRQLVFRTATNPLILGSALGVLSAVTDVHLPEVVFSSFEQLAAASVPMLLLTYGLSLHGQPVLRNSLYRREIISATVLKLLAMPAIAWLLGAFVFHLSPQDLFVIVVLAALPTQQNMFNYAQLYHVAPSLTRDVIFLTTLGCIPVLLLVTYLLHP